MLVFHFCFFLVFFFKQISLLSKQNCLLETGTLVIQGRTLLFEKLFPETKGKVAFLYKRQMTTQKNPNDWLQILFMLCFSRYTITAVLLKWTSMQLLQCLFIEDESDECDTYEIIVLANCCDKAIHFLATPCFLPQFWVCGKISWILVFILSPLHQCSRPNFELYFLCLIQFDLWF